MDHTKIVSSNSKLELTESFNIRHTLDVTNCPSKLIKNTTEKIYYYLMLAFIIQSSILYFCKIKTAINCHTFIYIYIYVYIYNELQPSNSNLKFCLGTTSLTL